MRLSVGLLAVCLGTSFSACHRPVATFQRSPREQFFSRIKPVSEKPSVTDEAFSQPIVPADDSTAVIYADARTERVPESVGQRIRLHQQRTQRLMTPVRMVSAGSATPKLPVGPANELNENVPTAIQPGPGPKNKQRKTLRELLGLPPRKKLNWWQRIPWQLKAAIVVTLVAVVFAVLHITVLAIVFGIIGAFLLIRGLKKSFKVRRGLFGLGG